MADTTQTLAIAGAAEGSWYSGVDLRYAASFANANSGMSFGVFQFDCATNSAAQAVLAFVLKTAVEMKTINDKTSKRLYASATRRNAQAGFAAADLAVMNALLQGDPAKANIDAADKNRAGDMQSWIDGMIALAANVWRAKKLTDPILTPGGKNNLRLFAYLLASLNRYPDNEDTFQDWLNGEVVKTKNGPAKGFQLKAPPTLDQMHEFFASLRIWDGSQGNYQYLRDRLDPVLDGLKA